jgi:kynureninase
VQIDQADPLGAIRAEFLLDDGIIYLDGNSLGALGHAAIKQVRTLLEAEWGRGLIRSWNEAGWIDAPRRIGDKLARLLGAEPGAVIVADSTSVNLFKLLAGAARLRHERPIILTEAENFPTDLYLAAGAVDLLGSGREVRTVPRTELRASLDQRVALLMLTHVDYCSGYLHDMRELTAAAHGVGALALWDLSHSAGAVPLNLNACGVDLAIGCGYKYLNGGPGAPAYLYVSRQLQRELRSPLWGWMGHAAPFDFSPSYTPGDGIAPFLCGTPPMLSMAALEAAIDLWLRVDLETVWRKSRALSDLLIRLVDERGTDLGFSVASPRDPRERGSHVAIRHAQGYRIMRALIDRGVIGDFRPPDLMRLALTPLYTRFVDIWDAVDRLVEVVAGRAYEAPEYAQRLVVT